MSNSDFKTCPGIKNFIRPIPEYLPCPSCGGNVEIWSDENTGVCDGCEKEIGRPQKEQSCLDWCEHASECRELIKRQKGN